MENEKPTDPKILGNRQITGRDSELSMSAGSLTRAEEYQMLEDLVALAGSLNVRTNVAEAILKLQEMANQLRKCDWKSGRKSFMLHLASQPDEFFQENSRA